MTGEKASGIFQAYEKMPGPDLSDRDATELGGGRY